MVALLQGQVRFQLFTQNQNFLSRRSIGAVSSPPFGDLRSRQFPRTEIEAHFETRFVICKCDPDPVQFHDGRHQR